MSSINALITLLLLAVCMAVNSARAADPIELTVGFSNADHYLISVPQKYADLTLSLYGADQSRLLKKVSFPWHKGLPEHLLIAKSDCDPCLIRIEGQGKADRSYRYTHTTTKVSNAADIDYFQLLTEAGAYSHAGRYQGKESRQIPLQKAKSALEDAIERASDVPKRLHAMTLLAETLYYLDEKESQQEVLKRILRLTDNEQHPLFRIHALYETAAFVEDIHQEHKLYNEAMSLAKQIETPRLFAMGANYKAVGLVRNGEFDSAMSLLNDARTTFEDLNAWRDLMYPLHNLSWAHQRAGKLPSSLEYATTQRLVAEHYGLQDHQVLGLYNFAITYAKLGSPSEAEGFLDQAIQAYEALPSYSNLSTVMSGYLLMERAERLLEQGAFSNAKDFLEQAKRKFKATGYPGRVADATFFEGEIAMAQKDLAMAKEKFNDVIQYDRDSNRDRNLGVHLLRLAELEIQAGNYVDASNSQVEALQLLSATEDYRALAAALGQASELLFHLGAYDDAYVVLKKAQAYTDKYGLKLDTAKLHYRTALINHRLGNFQLALAAISEAKKLIDEALGNIERLDLRRHFFALQRSVLELNIELLVNLHPNDATRSLLLAETMRARTLKEKLRRVDRGLGDLEEYVVQRRQLLSQIQQQAEKWYTQVRQSSPTELLKTTRHLGQRLQKLEARYRVAGLKVRRLADSDQTELRKVDENELVAFYMLGQRQSWLWAISRQGVEIHALPSQPALFELVDDYRDTIANAPSVRRNQDAWAQSDAIEALSKVIIQPLHNTIEQANITRLTIVPDGLLHDVPFAPLTLSRDSGPLVSTVSINIDIALDIERAAKPKPSMMTQSGKSQSGRILVVANPSVGSVLDVPVLPDSLREANAIRAIFDDNATLLVGDEATKSAFLGMSLDQFDILHFATHGLIHPDEPLLSGLVFSEGEPNSLWLAPEISDLSLQGKMVVLSACESSVGKRMSDEGALSLTRAFTEAGASHIIGSLWPVQDAASAELMRYFYHALINQGLSPNDALREAQMSMIKDERRWSDPYYWASFQLHHVF